MRNLRNEKGAITLVVIVTMLFLLAFLMSSYMIASNRAQKQKEISSEIESIYGNSENLNDIYNSYFSNEIIPIYTAEQLIKIGSNEQLAINNKYYMMSYSATYTLMNDLEFNESSAEILELLNGGHWTPINDNTNFTGDFEGNGHTIEVTNNAGEVLIYSTANNYSSSGHSIGLIDSLEVGDIVYYDEDGNGTNDEDEKYVVLYNDGTYGCQIISITPKPKLAIGASSLVANTRATGTNVTNKLRLEAKESNNNAVKILNQHCIDNYLNRSYGAYARSVGCDPLYGTMPLETALQRKDTKTYRDYSIFLNSAVIDASVTNKYKESGESAGFLEGVKTSDAGYMTDINVIKSNSFKSNLGDIYETTFYGTSGGTTIPTANQYWLASRSCSTDTTYANMCIMYMHASNRNTQGTWAYYGTGEYAINNAYTVHPVVTLKSEIIVNGGQGTRC